MHAGQQLLIYKRSPCMVTPYRPSVFIHSFIHSLIHSFIHSFTHEVGHLSGERRPYISFTSFFSFTFFIIVLSGLFLTPLVEAYLCVVRSVASAMETIGYGWVGDFPLPGKTNKQMVPFTSYFLPVWGVVGVLPPAWVFLYSYQCLRNRSVQTEIVFFLLYNHVKFMFRLVLNPDRSYIYRGGSTNSAKGVQGRNASGGGASGSSKSQVRGNFHTDKQNNL